MLLTKRIRKLVTVLLVCICIAVLAVVILRTTPTAIAKAQYATLDQKAGEAQQAMARADQLCANWKEASLRQAIEEYDTAALIWTSMSDFANASHATLRAGDIYFHFSEYAEALKRYENAEALAGKTDDWLAKAKALSHIGRLQSYIGNNDLAQKQLTAALQLFKQHEANRSTTATNAYGEAVSNLAEVSYAKGDFVNSWKQFESALNVFQNDQKAEAKVHLFMGYISGGLGETEKAVTELSRARDLYRAIKDKTGEALSLTALGLVHSRREDQSGAIKMHAEALEVFRSTGDRYGEASALNAFGQAYDKLSDYSRALDHYDRALRLFQNIGAVDGVAAAALQIAMIHARSGNPVEALAYYERCLKVSRAAGKLRIEANALNEIAKFYTAQGRYALALTQYQKVQKFNESIGDLRGQADASNAYGDLLFQLGQQRTALDSYNRALSLAEKTDDKGIQITALYNLARVNLKLNAPESALRLIRQSLKIIEDLRANVETPEFRASYFSGVRQHYDLCIKILMQLHQRRPEEGFDAEALSMSEQSRARLLLDLVSESRGKIHQGPANNLLDQERWLKGLLQSQVEYQMALSLSGKDPKEISGVADQIAQLRSEYQLVRAQLRQQNPRLWSLEQFPSLNLQRIQSELRDSDTMLLEYALGDERSYLWAVTSNSFHSYELPARKVLEQAAKELYKSITAQQGVDGQSFKDYRANVEAADKRYSQQARNLSQMLLGPLADQLGNRRLIVITEGGLQYIPFEVLPEPVSQTVGAIEADVAKTFLVQKHEVVVWPSVSTLIASRARIHTTSASRLVAVLADPVLSSSDERVQTAGSSAQAATDNPNQFLLETPIPEGSLTRLAHASEEADSISASAPWGTTMVAKGFDANREIAMGSDVGQYQILHFATHGFLDSEHPEMSAIVFTMVDRNGVKTNGLMALHDIYSLDLSAELTVLSACQTALGKEVKGEGLVGLTHSFLSAGSKSVVASLWKVDDQATAVFMADFYGFMLQKGMTPAAALRAAKLKMMKSERWSAPYYWAGFVLQGEYANKIAVDRYSWLHSRLVLLFLLIPIATSLLIFLKRKRRLS